MIADIHFQPKYVFAAIDAGCAAVRVNPGNIKQFDDKVKEIAQAASRRRHADPDRRQRGLAGHAAAAEVRQGDARGAGRVGAVGGSLFEEHGFRDIKISVKHNDPVVMVNAYRQLAAQCDYPLHLGVTEAGPAFQGTIKSAVAFGALLGRGHRRHDPGLAVRPAGRGGQGRHPDPGVAEPASSAAWRSSPARPAAAPRSTSTSWPTRSRAGLEGMEVPLRVAVMGCVVNGPGEAREADLGVASGNGKGQIFVKGEVIKTVPESKIVETLIEEAMKIAEQMEKDGVASGEPAGRRRRADAAATAPAAPAAGPGDRSRGPAGRSPGAPWPAGTRARAPPGLRRYSAEISRPAW